MLNKIFGVWGCLFLLACGHKTAPVGTSTEDLRGELDAKLAAVRTWAPTCDSGRNLSFPSEVGCQDQDATYMNGQLCLVGEVAGCEAVRASVNAAGRLYRSPRLMGVEGPDTASRDALLGFLAYLVATHDQDAAERVYAYLTLNARNLCPVSVDGRCSVTMLNLGLMSRVWRGIGLTPSAEMLAGEATLDAGLYTEAQTTPVGYQLTLVALEVLLVERLGQYNTVLAKAMEVIGDRQPTNPFYAFIRYGKSDAQIQTILNLIPEGSSTNKTQWSIMRDTAEHAERDSLGWEFIFLGALEEGK